MRYVYRIFLTSTSPDGVCQRKTAKGHMVLNTVYFMDTLASNYLESTHLPIQEIAYLLDYAQPGPFSRAFKKYHLNPIQLHVKFIIKPCTD